MPRLWEIVDELSDEKKPRLIRGDVGYGGDENMCEAECRSLTYLLKLRRTKTVLEQIRKHENDHGWIVTEDGWEVMESNICLSGRARSRRCILLRRLSKLQQVYRDRGDCENNFDEYKNQYG
jgi:hypothetical protein